MSNNRSELFIGGLIIGAAIGTLTGLLIAPRAGSETRKLLKKSADALPELAEDLSSSVQLQAERLSEEALRRWEETLARLKEALAAGIEAYGLESQSLNQMEVNTKRNAVGNKLSRSAAEIRSTESPGNL